jgi:hypothetical protein
MTTDYKALSLEQAIVRMRSGSRLVYTQGKRSARRWSLEPGGLVSEATASAIRRHPNVVGGQDGLLPGHDQTCTFARSRS